MFTITGFADEIDSNPEVQAELFNRMGIQYLDFRSAWDKNVLELTGSELAEYKRILNSHNIGISCIGSPVGKTHINDDPREFERLFNRAIDIALMFNVKYVRVFSFYLKQDERNDPSIKEKIKEKIFSRIKYMAEKAADKKLILLHENERGIYGEKSDDCKEVIQAADNTSFRAVFDPSNFIAVGEDPLTESFPTLKPYIEYLHIKDKLRSSGKLVPPGEGDACIGKILNNLRDRDLFVSLEPHLAQAGQFKGFTGPNLFMKAHSALMKIIKDLEIAYC